MCLGAVVMSDVDAIMFGLADKMINPARMLEIEYVRKHIKYYEPRPLALAADGALWRSSSTLGAMGGS